MWWSKVLQSEMRRREPKFRSFKTFDLNVFNDVISRITFHAAYVFKDIDDTYWAHERVLTDVIDEHAPIKERISKARKPAFMNGNLRRAIYKKTHAL